MSKIKSAYVKLNEKYKKRVSVKKDGYEKGVVMTDDDSSIYFNYEFFNNDERHELMLCIVIFEKGKSNIHYCGNTFSECPNIDGFLIECCTVWEKQLIKWGEYNPPINENKYNKKVNHI